jgi:hypothetical protein
MSSIADGSVKIQTTSEVNFSTPAWFGARGADQQVSTPRIVFASLINEQERRCRGSVLAAMSSSVFSRCSQGYAKKRRAHPGGVLRATPAVRRPQRAPERDRD